MDNSGYGELGRIVGGRFEPVVRLPGWTRGLCFARRVAFVGTSRVIPRFRRYAPGLDLDRSEAGVHAVDWPPGGSSGSLVVAVGNQIFAVERAGFATAGFPFSAGSGARARERFFFAASPLPLDPAVRRRG